MMRHLRTIAWAMTLAGVALAIGAMAFSLDEMLVLAGIMLAWAGIVKVIVVHLWTNVAGLGTDRHDPIPPL
ncbi:MAG TPA: hypothetical protein VD767_07680 [Thermomicrobiales bacterium]|nr:hypothetical protein [Thermomicrobiales bacterium]